ncbi:MAG: hypothetical protein IH944_13825 [Armatimonadetes bacterium]|nr:hypothetical protein [Armatimonadota bacterium]
MKDHSYLKGVSQSRLKDIRQDSEATLAHLRSLDGLDWEHLLYDICGEDPTALELIVARPAELVTNAASLFRNLSEQTKMLASDALTRVIRSLQEDTDASVLENALFLAEYIPFTCDTSILANIVNNTSYDISLRCAALAALSANSSSQFDWSRIDARETPEFIPIIAISLSNAAPLEALRLLSNLTHGVDSLTITSTAKTIISHLSRQEADDIRSIIQEAQPYASAALKFILEDKKFFDDFGRSFSSTRKLNTLVRNIIDSKGTVKYIYTGYYSGSHTFPDTPKPIKDYVQAMVDGLQDIISPRSISDRFNLIEARLPLVSFDSLIDDVFDGEMIQMEPAFASAKRLRRGSMVTVGVIRKVSVIVPKRHIAEVRNAFRLEPDPTLISNVLRFCIRHNFKLISQPSSAIQEELTAIAEEEVSVIAMIHLHDPKVLQWAPLFKAPYTAVSDVQDLGLLLRHANDLNVPESEHRILVIVDTITAKIIRDLEKASITVIPAEFDHPLDVGYFVPSADSSYRRLIEASVQKALYDTRKQKWDSRFAQIMKVGSVELLPTGPDYSHSTGEFESVEGLVIEDIKRSSRRDQ